MGTRQDAVRRTLEVALGLLVGIGLVSLATGDRPNAGVVLGVGFASVVVLALSCLDGPLEKRTARIAAIVCSTIFVGAALLLV
ncbi:hypothetical protein RBH26_01545 [Natronolimnohabitans sp. A-GB9]|uniref:hypothetical protein n=1 Tax=Natronolimnohabitans sp. A-GB9 TaxID=3069757 RepID=UPI0027B1A1EB|nr:hypothetical protein [Natronolimnohabitans sp. A-GB9]MDQ2049159.1 hypothetical protein [Natronolimnohabitans sp. A-GB9]